MSSDKRYVLSAIRSGQGCALDLGGGTGDLQGPITQRGYAYVNVDIAPSGGRAVRGDAAQLPFGSDTFDLVVSSDTLEHFTDPKLVILEVRRVLKKEGSFVIWVPFMHPFHGDDYYRYTPIGLRFLLESGGFRIENLEAPLWVFSVMAQALIVLMRRVGLGVLETPVERAAAWLDRRLSRFGGSRIGFAASYLVLARPDGGNSTQASG